MARPYVMGENDRLKRCRNEIELRDTADDVRVEFRVQ